MELLSSLINLVSWYLRPLIKWFLRQTTRLCELQRVCYGETSGAPRTLAIGELLSSEDNIRNFKLLCVKSLNQESHLVCRLGLYFIALY